MTRRSFSSRPSASWILDRRFNPRRVIGMLARQIDANPPLNLAKLSSEMGALHDPGHVASTACPRKHNRSHGCRTCAICDRLPGAHSRVSVPHIWTLTISGRSYVAQRKSATSRDPSLGHFADFAVAAKGSYDGPRCGITKPPSRSALGRQRHTADGQRSVAPGITFCRCQ